MTHYSKTLLSCAFLGFFAVFFMASTANAQTCPNTGPLTCTNPSYTSTILFFEDWENDNAQGWTGNIAPGPSPQAGRWNIRSGGTTSQGTGPLSADCGNEYIYWETSGGSPPVNLNFPSPFDLANASDAEISFYWHAATAFATTIVSLQVSTNGGGSWTTEYTITGGDTPNQSDPFTLTSVDLSAYLGSSVLIRFNGNLDTGFDDIALDNIQVQACSMGSTPAAVPTMSEWGLIILGLLLLTTCTVAIRRRKLAFAGG